MRRTRYFLSGSSAGPMIFLTGVLVIGFRPIWAGSDQSRFLLCLAIVLLSVLASLTCHMLALVHEPDRTAFGVGVEFRRLPSARSRARH